ncbi:glycosyltransferase [Pontibacter russatus]|uniref:glycosyltransferase n=1 Tax=Pontibacter russatus TaxID=2694929 RepID=UPI00137AD169|nr:glycosyltransferase [Pontibacter russatus]
MHGGGSERVVSHLVRHINPDKFEIILALIKKEGVFLKGIPENVEIVNLDLSRTRYAPLKIFRLLRKQKPDIVFSTLGHLNLMIASLRRLLPKSIRFIARESSTVSLHNKNEVYPALFDFLFRTVYKSFDKIVCQSGYMQQDLIQNYNIPAEKTLVINNPVDEAQIHHIIGTAPNPFQDPGRINFVAVGRLSKEKGFDRLIKAFKYIEDRSIHLSIIGDGVDKDKLVSLAEAEHLTDRISFLGFIPNPYVYMRYAKALIQTSYYEGFPNVVIEANACGVPVIGFRSPGGISEIINNTICGTLVEDDNQAALAESITQVAHTEYDRQRIMALTTERYALNKIISSYEALFSELSNS